MGYSRSVNAVLRVKSYLEELVNARGNLEWRASDPNRFAYQLREGFSVSKRYREQYPEYAQLNEKYRIVIVDNRVVAQLKNVLDIQPVAHGRITIANASSVLEVIAAALQHKAPVMHFPNANVLDDNITKLRKWCEISDYTCEVDNNGNGVYLTKK